MLDGALGQSVAAHDVLVDAPPTELEVEFNVDVYFPKQETYRPLGDISPVVRTLAREQFDDYVKRVRIFVHPRLAVEAQGMPHLNERLADAIESERAFTIQVGGERLRIPADAEFNVELTTDQGRYKMVGYDGGDYPALPRLDDAPLPTQADDRDQYFAIDEALDADLPPVQLDPVGPVPVAVHRRPAGDQRCLAPRLVMAHDVDRELREGDRQVARSGVVRAGLAVGSHLRQHRHLLRQLDDVITFFVVIQVDRTIGNFRE